MTTVTRIEYDPSGDTRVLGLPGVVRTEEWDGEVREGGLTIDDAFWISKIKIPGCPVEDSVRERIGAVRNQERQWATGFLEPVVLGFPGDSLDWTQGPRWKDSLRGMELTGVEIPGGLQVGGIPVSRVWKATEGISYWKVSSGEVLLDNRESMEDYSVPGAPECVYRVLGLSETEELRRECFPGMEFIAGPQVYPGTGGYDSVYPTHGWILLGILGKVSMNKLVSVVALPVEPGGTGAGTALTEAENPGLYTELKGLVGHQRTPGALGSVELGRITGEVHLQDNRITSLDSGDYHTPWFLDGVTGLTASGCPGLTGTVDITGMDSLENIDLTETYADIIW